MATSGTVSQTTFTTRKVIDEAFRLCLLTPQQITPEHIESALSILYLFLSTLANKGIPLWCIERRLLPLYEAVYTIPTPNGTVDIMNVNIRTLNRLSGTPSSTEGVAANAFDGDLETACIETTPAGSITLEFDDETAPTSFGIMPNATGTWDITIRTSIDGVVYQTIYSNTTFEAVAGEWQWFDVEGIPSVNYVRLQANGTTILSVTEFYIGNNPQAIPLGSVNRDDYSNLPNRTFQGRPTEYWTDKQRAKPNMLVWPVPSASFTFSQIEVWLKRFVQDVGTMSQTLDIPQNWFLAIVHTLAYRLAISTKEVDREIIPNLKEDMGTHLSDAWAGQSDGMPVRIVPNISPYTR